MFGVAPDPDFGSNGFVYHRGPSLAAGGCASPPGASTSRAGHYVGNAVVRLPAELLTGIRTDGVPTTAALRIGPDKLWARWATPASRRRPPG
jgi:hypothetical protein